jgi:hypothetical protein
MKYKVVKVTWVEFPLQPTQILANIFLEKDGEEVLDAIITESLEELEEYLMTTYQYRLPQNGNRI